MRALAAIVALCLSTSALAAELDVHVRAGLCATLIAKRPDSDKEVDLVLRHAPNVMLALEHGGRWMDEMDANKNRPQVQRRLIDDARRACATFGVATTASDR